MNKSFPPIVLFHNFVVSALAAISLKRNWTGNVDLRYSTWAACKKPWV